jgi:predicted transcriptional regulator
MTMDEALNVKIENQQKLIAELTDENEKLYQQFNHLMVRNSKLLKRIDDLQQIIDNMHLRVEELQLANENMFLLRGNRTAEAISGDTKSAPSPDFNQALDKLNLRIDELNLRNDILQKRANLFSQYSGELAKPQEAEEINKPKINQEVLFSAWKNYPGQNAKNTPNLRRQMEMLIHLYENEALNSHDLFNKTGVNGVTGPRYIFLLRKFDLIEYRGARKKGKYLITDKGRRLIECAIEGIEVSEGSGSSELDFFNPADL